LTLDAIARQSGVSKGAATYFKTKEAVLEALWPLR
jgi:AcrR family transcriptional regulator